MAEFKQYNTLRGSEVSEQKREFAPGIYHGVSNAEYHSVSGISKSGLDLVAKSPQHYFARYLDPNRPEAPAQTAAQLDGELAHCAILEPAYFADRFLVGPDLNRNTKAWKEFADSAEAQGKTPIKSDQWATAWAQAASVGRIPDLAAALANGMPEVSAFWTDEETGVLCKCRPDFVQYCGAAGVILVDVKTCGNASPKEFARMIAQHRYHVQAAWYSDGYAIASGQQVLGFIFAAVEMAYPYAASAIMLDAESIDQGRLDYRRNLNTYAACKASGEWPGYGNEVHMERLPGWAFDQEEDLEIGFL